MQAGRLDRRVTLQRPVEGRSAAGDATTTWQDVATIWAGRQDARGREYFAAAAVQAELETLFRIRWRPDVVASWRLLCDGAAYDIQSVAEIGRRDGLELRCLRREEG